MLKPGKGQGIVLLSHEDYVSSLQRIFYNPSKFKKIKQDPTINRLTTVQKYLKTLFNRGEITESEMKAMRPKFAHIKLSTQDNSKLLQQLKSDFKRVIKRVQIVIK